MWRCRRKPTWVFSLIKQKHLHLVDICDLVDGSSILQTNFSTLTTDSFVSFPYHKPVSDWLLVSNAFHAATLLCPANRLTVSQPVTAWEAGNTESKEASCFISWTGTNLGAVFVPDINHVSLISFEMKQLRVQEHPYLYKELF